jgi:RimJ/RimL family protein N-acetyltransferase
MTQKRSRVSVRGPECSLNGANEKRKIVGSHSAANKLRPATLGTIQNLHGIITLCAILRIVTAFPMPPEPLIGPRIQLRPMLVSDGPALVEAAADGELWNLPFTIVPSAKTVDSYIRTALDDQANGTAIPFVTQILETKRTIGSTRFWKVDRQHRKLEIGWTWLSASWQRTFVNTEAKFLMLSFAFEKLNFVRVQFVTDELNESSRAAILRLGAKQEGVLRNDFIMPNGRKRNSVLFSIVADEWPDVRRKLQESLKASAS